MNQGKIRKLVIDRGFGFIDGGNGDLFFHHSSLVDTSIEEVHEGQRVEFDIGRGQRGPCATSVRLVEELSNLE